MLGTEENVAKQVVPIRLPLALVPAQSQGVPKEGGQDRVSSDSLSHPRRLWGLLKDTLFQRNQIALFILRLIKAHSAHARTHTQS